MKSILSLVGSHVEKLNPLADALREGARRMLLSAIETEVGEYLAARAEVVDSQGRRLVVRNGYHDERTIVTGIGEISVKKPRVHDKRTGEEREVFQSKILPPYLRRTKEIEDLIPWLYLKGVSTNDFSEALTAITGQEIGGLSQTTVVRLKEQWLNEYKSWQCASLKDKNYVYIWADGVYFNVRLTGERQCILVVIGALEDGTKELIAVRDGFRESEISWTEVLVDLKKRGLQSSPKLAIGDGALGFWAALERIFPTTRIQRCWCHKTANILNKLPKKINDTAKSALHEIWMSETRKDAIAAYNSFVETYKVKYEKAAECLSKDIEEMLAFYDFPAEHWSHLRTTNPIESAFATVRLRTKRTKGSGSAEATLMMVFKLMQAAQKQWRKLRGYALLKEVVEEVKFVDGLKKAA
jgi:transposase-like protein